MARERLDRHGSRQKRKQSSKTERESKTSPLTVLAVLIIFMIIVYTMSIVYSSSSDRDVPGLSMITSLFNVGSSESAVSTAVHDKLHEYEEIVLKARHLAMRYKNITGKSPPGASPVTTNGDTNNKPTESSEQQHTSSSSSVTSWLRNHIGIGNSHNFLRPTGGAPVNDGTQTSASATTKQSESDVSKTGTTTADSTTIGATDLIIGIAQDTDPKNLAVFCKSLRRWSSTAEVMIFMNSPVPSRNKEIAEKANVKVVEFDLTSLATTIQKYHPSTLRWPLFYRFFQDTKVRSQYGRVLMMDVRDSYFQSDPFALMPPPTQSSFYAFNGVESINIGQCGWNGGWVRDCFGDGILNDVSNQKIICSGISIGSMDAVFQYLTLMDDVIMAKHTSAISQAARFPQCERNGVDQGVHNVLVHKGLIPSLRIWSQHDSFVANMQAKRASVRDHVVFNPAGAKVAIVHQYDRDADLQKFLFQEYVDWVNTNDPMEEWKGESACSVYTPTHNIDSFKGICDLKMQGGATSASSCCQQCDKVVGCQAFTFFGGVCYLKSCKISRMNHNLPGAVSAVKTA